MSARHLAPGLIAALVMATMFGVGVAAGVALDRRVLQPRPALFVDREGPGLPPFVPGAPLLLPGLVGAPGHGLAARPSALLDRFARDLDLTPAQTAAIDSVMRDEFAAVRALRDEMAPRIRAAIDNTRRKIDSLLTPAQRERYHAMLLEQQRPLDRIGASRRAGRGGGPP